SFVVSLNARKSSTNPAMPQRWTPRRNPRRHCSGSSRLRNSTLRPPRRHPTGSRQPDRVPGHRRYTPALPATQDEVRLRTLAGPRIGPPLTCAPAKGRISGHFRFGLQDCPIAFPPPTLSLGRYVERQKMNNSVTITLRNVET